MHVENNFLVDVFFQVNSFSKMTFHTSLRNSVFFTLLQVETICLPRYCFVANLSSHPKTQGETE